MKQTLFVLFFSLLLLVTPVTAKTLSKVAAIVNDEVITTFQLDKAVVTALGEKANRNQLTTGEFEKIKSQILEKLVNDKLLEQRIKELGLSVSEAEIEQAIEDVQRKNGLTRATLIEALETQGSSLEKYRKQVKNEILRYRLLGQEVNYKVLVTSKDVRDYFEAHKGEYDLEPKIRVNRISFTLPQTDNEEELAELNQQIEACRKRLQDGEDFDQVLASQGENTTGGDMGLVAEADLAEPLQQALAHLEVGGVSEPIESNGQRHLFQVVEKIGSTGDPFDLYKANIEETLKREKTDIRFKEWQQELRANAYIDIRM